MLTLLRRRARDEGGATLVLFCLILIGLLVTAGLVLDFGLVRADRTQNKGTADVAVAAGMRSLELGGYPAPFRGVCGAAAYLKANHPQLTGLTTATNVKKGNGAATSSTDPCTAGAPEQSQWCVPNDKSTWAWYEQTIGGLTVTIKNGYELDEGGYPDETLVGVGNDQGSLALGNCDHLAVMITETAQPGFGKVAYAGNLTTKIRSVGRITQVFDPQAVIALLLLEREDCNVLRFNGTNSVVQVKGNGIRPGIIHSDSIGNDDPTTSDPGGDNCGQKILNGAAATIPASVDPLTGAIIPAYSGASILAGSAESSANPPDPPASGSVSVTAKAGAAFADPTTANTSCPSTVLAEPWSFPLVTPGPCVTGSTRKGRVNVDALYRERMVALRAEAKTWTSLAPAVADDPPYGFTVVGCSPASPITATKVYVDCNNFNNAATFDAPDQVIVFNGRVSAGSLTFTNPDKVYVKGASNGVTVSGTLSVNAGSAANCSDRGDNTKPGGDRSKSTKFVVMNGSFQNTSGLGRMCQTMLLLANDNNETADPPAIPATNGVGPYDNTFDGNISVSGTGSFDWSAPNATDNTMEWDDAGDDPFLDNFENLAFWTESQSGNGLSGGGSTTLKGVFFLPNANPFEISGGSGQNINRDAQFIIRKLFMNGNGFLTMKPSIADSIKFPYFSNFSLVR